MTDPRWGFTDAWSAPGEPADIERELVWLEQLGVEVARFGVGPETPHELLDSIVTRLEDRGIKPMFVFGGWAPAMATDTYQGWLEAIAGRYGARIQYALWNEPNLDPAMGQPLSVGTAIELNRAGLRGVRAASADAVVLASPLSPVAGWRDYFHALYRELPADLAAAVHLYPSQRDPEARLRAVEDNFKLVKAKGRPVHVTEIDMAAPWIHKDADAPNLAVRGYKLLRDLGARSIIYFSIRNHRREASAIAEVA